MHKLIAKPAILVLAVVFSLLATNSAVAGNEKYDAGTIFLFSTEDMPTYQKASEQSDFGAFLKDPAIVSITSRLKAAFTEMQAFGKQQAAQSGQSQMVEMALSVVQDYAAAMQSDLTGRFSFAFGVRDTGAMPQPYFLVHFQGKSSFAALHSRLLGLVPPMLPKDSFSADGVQFSGVMFPPEEGAPVTLPEGLYFGNKGNDYYISVGKAVAMEFMTKKENRLGSDAFYNQMKSKVGTGAHGFSFFNTAPLFKMLKSYTPMIPDSNKVFALMDALKLESFKGAGGNFNYTAKGVEGKGLLALSGRDGIWSVLGQSNAALSPSAYAPAKVLSYNQMKLDYRKILGLVMEVAQKVEGPEAKSDIEGGLAMAKQQYGIDVQNLLNSLEGTSFVYTPAPKGPLNLMNVQSANAVVMGLKLTSPSAFIQALDKMLENPMAGMRSEMLGGKKVYLLGPEAEETPFGAPPVPALCIDGDTFLFSINKADLLTAFETKTSGKNLSSSATYQAAMAGRSNGIGISFTDSAESLCMVAGLLRTALPMAGMFAPPQVSSVPGFQNLTNPQNIPSDQVIRKYFGVSGSNFSWTDAGLWIDAFTPKVSGSAKKGL